MEDEPKETETQETKSTDGKRRSSEFGFCVLVASLLMWSIHSLTAAFLVAASLYAIKAAISEYAVDPDELAAALIRARHPVAEESG